MLFLSLEGDINTLINQIVSILKTLYNIILVVVPIIMLVLGTIDLIKAVSSGDEKEVKTATSMLGKRILYGVGTFLVMSIVELVIAIVTDDPEWSIVWGVPGSSSKKITLNCPSEIEYSNVVNVVVGEIKANKEIAEINIPAGYEYIKTNNSSGKLKRTAPDTNYVIQELIIRAKDKDGNSAECRVKIKK
jgi:hypothetical protein